MDVSKKLLSKNVTSLKKEFGLYLMLEDDGNIAIYSPYKLLGLNDELELIGKKQISYKYDDSSYTFYFSNEIELKVNNSTEAMIGPEVLMIRSGNFSEVFYPPKA